MSATAQANPIAPLVQAFDFSKLQYLQSRVEHLESQLKEALAYSAKKEAYANTLEEDLEHLHLFYIEKLKNIVMID